MLFILINCKFSILGWGFLVLHLAGFVCLSSFGFAGVSGHAAV